MGRRAVFRLFPLCILLWWPLQVLGQGVSITFLHTPPKQAIKGRDLVIAGGITGADQVTIAAVAFRLEGKKRYEVRELRLVGKDTYEGAIPGKIIESAPIEYYCYAVDFDGNRHTIFASLEKPQRVQVANSEVAWESVGKIDNTEKPKPEEANKSIEPSEDILKKTTAKTSKALSKDATEDMTTLGGIKAQTVDAVPATVHIVNREQIELMGARTLAEVLAVLPGIHTVRSVSGNYQVVARGLLSDSATLVLLDGIRLNDSLNGRALLEFPAEAVERVEVLLGPGSSRFGQGAMAAVVNVVTQRINGFEAQAGAGGFNTVRLSAGGGSQSESYAIHSQAQFVYSDGQKRTVDQDVWTGVVGALPGNKPDVSNTPGSVDDRRVQFHGQVGGGYRNDSFGEISMLLHYLFQQRGALIGQINSLDHGSELSLHWFASELAYRLPITRQITFSSRLTFKSEWARDDFLLLSKGDNAYNAGGTWLTDGLRQVTTKNDQSLGLEALISIRAFTGNFLLAGLQVEYFRLPQFNLERSIGDAAPGNCTSGSGACINVLGYDLPIGKHPGVIQGKERLVAGLHLEDQWINLLPGLDLLAGLRADIIKEFGVALSPRAGLVYTIAEKYRLKFDYGRAFRLPSLIELYGDSSFDPISQVQGSPSLRLVTVDTLEAGMECRLANRPVDYLLRGRYFYSWVHDDIAALEMRQGTSLYKNLQSLDWFGAEIEGIARIGNRHRLSVSGSWFSAKVTKLLPAKGNGGFLTDTPQLLFKVNLDFAVSWWLNVHVGLQHWSERRNSVRQPLEMLRAYRIPAGALVQLGVSTEPVLMKHLMFYAYLYNLLDSDLRDPVPRPDQLPGLLPMEPFTFMMGIAWRP